MNNTNNNNNVCDLCSKNFSKTTNLNRHITSVHIHKKLKQPNYQYSISFASKWNLTRHNRNNKCSRNQNDNVFMINRVLLLNRVPVTWRTYRFLSNTRKTILVTINDKTGVTTLTFKNPPVNSIDFDLLTEFGEVLTHLEQEKSRGLIITSGIPNVFLAGLDLFEFYKPDKKRLETFWRTLENTWLKLYTSSFPTVALINGHSPGGGCVLSTSCEYRVILGKHYKIGLNEASVGLIPPFWFMDTMRNAIGYRQAEISFSTGTLHPASDALSIGLVDFVTDDEVQAFEKINEFFSKQHKVDAYTRAIMKKEFRQDMVEKFERKREEYIQCMGAEVLAPETQIKLEGYLNAMKKKVEQK